MGPPVRERLCCPPKQPRFCGGARKITEMDFHPQHPRDAWNCRTSDQRTKPRDGAAKLSAPSLFEIPPYKYADRDENQRQVTQFCQISGGDAQPSRDPEPNTWCVAAKPSKQTDERQSKANRREYIVIDSVEGILGNRGDQKRNAKSQRDLIGKHHSGRQIGQPNQRGHEHDVARSNPIERATAFDADPLTDVEPSGSHNVIKRWLRGFLVRRAAPDLF